MSNFAKHVLRSLFWVSVGGVLAPVVLWNLTVLLGWQGPQATTSALWIPAFIIAAIAAFLGTSPEKSEEDGDGYRPARLIAAERQGDELGTAYPTDPKKNRSEPQPFPDTWPAPKQGGNQQFAVAGASAGGGVALPQGGALAGVLGNHMWLILGMLLAAGAFFAALQVPTADEKAVPFLAAVFLATGSIACFLAQAGKLGTAMAEIGEKHLAKVWFAISLIFLVASVMYTNEEFVSWWESGFVWLAGISTILSGLAAMGKLGTAVGAVGTWYMNAVSFKYHPFLGMLMLAVTIFMLGGLLFLVSGVDPVQETGSMAENLGELIKWVFAIGFFVLIFAVLAFKKK